MSTEQKPKDKEIFKSAYAQYWDMVKDLVDEEGWVYVKDVPHLLDAYFEGNTGKEIHFQKSHVGEKQGSRWRPKELVILYCDKTVKK